MRVFHQKSTSAAIEYYTELSEYYGPGDEEKKAVWFGKGAERLGLTPDREVDKETFSQLARNIDPSTGQRLTQRNHSGRRVLTDVTLSMPKSLSIMWAQLEDHRLLDAGQEAALETMGLLEKDAATRVNQTRGEMSLKHTGNVVGVMWTHTTSRPVADHPDPQGHYHCCLLNATHDAERDRWTALDISTAVRDSGYYNAVFMSKLADKVQQLGYEIERSEHNFEIKGVNNRELIDKFSRRSQQIGSKAKQLGITNADARDALGAKTRSKKDQNLVPPEQLHDKWRTRLTDAEDAMIRSAAPAPHAIKPEIGTTKSAVDYALNHHLEKLSVVRTRQVLREALLQGIGGTTLEQLEEEINSRSLIRSGQDGEAELTTPAVLAEEQALVQFAKKGRGACQPINPGHRIERDFLSDEQRNAVIGLLNSPDRLMVVNGKAGVGKTTLMKEAISGMQQGGRRVTVLAPQAETAHGLLREREGFDANTIASFLLDEKAQKQARGGVLWIDEAGQVSMREMMQLISVASTIEARIVLSGDRTQHKAVGRGEPLRLLETDGGVKPFEISNIRRQEDDKYREAVTAFSKGNVSKGLEILDEAGHIHEVEDDQERANRIAEDYADAIEAGKTTLVVSPSNAERQAVTEAIREELKSRGHINPDDERGFFILSNRHLSAAQKSDAHSYTAGEDIIEFHRKVKGGWQSGTRVLVSDVRDGQVFVEGANGEMPVPIEAASAFNVYRTKATNFAPGDTLRITKNKSPEEGKNSKRLNNGSLATLTGFTKSGDLRLDNGQTISPNWGHIDHGVTITSYASQGKGFQHVIIAQSAMSAAASSKEQAYVSSSRGKRSLNWYTDSKEDLKAATTKERPQKLATELARDARRLKDHLRRHAAREQQLRRWTQQPPERARA